MNQENSTQAAASVTRWMRCLGDGDQEAARLLWSFVSDRLLKLARREVGQGRAAAYDEEDVANSAFGALCAGFEGGRYDTVANRDELWRLLAVITGNKARTRARDESRIKRGGQLKRVEVNEAFLEKIASTELSPEIAVACQDECERLLALLQKDDLKMVALLKVEGYTNDEIAEQLGCTRRSVQRRLNLIREFWSAELGDE